MHPITEMFRYLAGWTREARAERNWGELLGVEAAQLIVEDILKFVRKLCGLAHKVECNADEALKAIAAAQAPDSDGGELITPREAKTFQPLLVRARDDAVAVGDCEGGGCEMKPADFAAVESPSLYLAPAPRPASLHASPLVEETIRQLRNHAGWWEGDANARKVLAAMLRRAAK